MSQWVMGKVAAQTPDGFLAAGYVFATNFYDLNKPPMRGQSGPMILDRNLHAVWFQPVPEDVVASNLTLQSYRGKPVLGWWEQRKALRMQDMKFSLVISVFGPGVYAAIRPRVETSVLVEV